MAKVPLIQRWLAAVFVAATCSGCADAPQLDLVISGGSVLDGTGAAARRADVGITGDRIVAVGSLVDRTAASRIDAAGKIVAPGFIDALGRSGLVLLSHGDAESHLRQGITTEMLGDHSPAFWTSVSFDESALRMSGLTLDWSGANGYFSKLEARGTAINVGTLMPLSAGPGSPAAIDAAMTAGAFGVMDDIGRNGPDLGAAAAVVGRHGGVLMASAGSPAFETDDALPAIAAKAGRMIVDLSGVPEESVGAWIQRMIASNRQTPVYGVVTLYPGTAGGDRVVADALRYGGVLVGTGSAATSISSARPDASPAALGTYARLLGPLTRDSHVFDVAEAVRRITSVPAAAFQIAERGIIRENTYADIVVFDPATIADRATAENPLQYPTGIDYVIVNGVVVLTPRGLSGSRPGQRLVHGVSAR